jgi:hypothetical protein
VRLFDELKARTLELSESLDQQTATSEVLSGLGTIARTHQPALRFAASGKFALWIFLFSDLGGSLRHQSLNFVERPDQHPKRLAVAAAPGRWNATTTVAVDGFPVQDGILPPQTRSEAIKAPRALASMVTPG